MGKNRKTNTPRQTFTTPNLILLVSYLVSVPGISGQQVRSATRMVGLKQKEGSDPS